MQNDAHKFTWKRPVDLSHTYPSILHISPTPIPAYLTKNAHTYPSIPHISPTPIPAYLTFPSAVIHHLCLGCQGTVAVQRACIKLRLYGLSWMDIAGME